MFLVKKATIKLNDRKQEIEGYSKVCEINDGPSDARGTTEDGEYEDPRKEKDEDVCGPNARVREPLRVPVQIRRWHRLHVQFCHQSVPKIIPF